MGARFTYSHRSSAGVTLLELLVAITLFAIMGVVLASMWHTFARTWSDSEKIRKTVEKADHIIRVISQDFKATVTRSDGRLKQPSAAFMCFLDNKNRQVVSFQRTHGMGLERADVLDADIWNSPKVKSDRLPFEFEKSKIGIRNIEYRMSNYSFLRTSKCPFT